MAQTQVQVRTAEEPHSTSTALLGLAWLACVLLFALQSVTTTGSSSNPAVSDCWLCSLQCIRRPCWPTVKVCSGVGSLSHSHSPQIQTILLLSSHSVEASAQGGSQPALLLLLVLQPHGLPNHVQANAPGQAPWLQASWVAAPLVRPSLVHYCL